MRRIGLTATRHGMNGEQKTAFRLLMDSMPGTLHHGCCLGGDVDGHLIAREFGWWIVGHPPTEPTLRATLACDELRQAKTYLVRNKDLVDETDALIAVPSEPEEQQRGGTWSTFRYAKQQGKQVALILPNGNVDYFDA